MRRLTLIAALALPIGLAANIACADPVSDFIAADSNRNGTLEAPEFKQFIDLRADGGHPAAKRVRTFGAYSMALSRVDYDGDGTVSGDELKRYDKTP